jgi:Domain of unknown function (DUF4388)
MGSGGPIRVRYDSAPQAQQAYREGLRLGVVAIPEPDGPAPGQRVEVRLDLVFARRTFRLEGEVTERSAAGTVIHLDLLPLGVHELLSVEELDPLGVPEESLGDSEDEDSQSEMTDTVDPDAPASFSLDENSEVMLSRDDEGSFLDSADPDSGPSTASVDTQERFFSIAGEDAGRPWPVADHDPDDRDTVDRGPGGLGEREIPAGARMSTEPRRSAVTPPPPGATVGGMPIPGDATVSLPAVARFEGTVEEAGWPPVLLTIMRDELSGVLVVDSPSQRCWIYCHAGSPVHVVRVPPREADNFEPNLESRALLDPGIAERCRYLAQATGRSYLSVLMRLELVDESQLHELRTELVTRALLELVTEVSGPFRFFDLPELAGLFHHTPAAVMDALLRWALERNEALTPQQSEELRKRHVGEHVFLTTLGERLYRHVELRPEESRTMTRMLFDDQTIGEVLAHSRLNTRQLIRLVLALFQVGLVELGRVEPGPARVRLLAVRDLQAIAGRLGRDHFTLIGAHWTDPSPVLEQALERTREIVEAVPREDGESPELGRLRENLTLAMTEAAEALLDANARRRYRDSQVDLEARRLAAQQLFRRGKIAARHEDREEALRCLSTVLELDPGGAASGDRLERAERALEALRAGQSV